MAGKGRDQRHLQDGVRGQKPLPPAREGNRWIPEYNYSQASFVFCGADTCENSGVHLTPREAWRVDRTPPVGSRTWARETSRSFWCQQESKTSEWYLITEGVWAPADLAPNAWSEITARMSGVHESIKRCQDARRTVLRCDLMSGSRITYDQLTDGIMWAQGLFSLPVKITFLAPFSSARWSFFFFFCI